MRCRTKEWCQPDTVSSRSHRIFFLKMGGGGTQCTIVHCHVNSNRCKGVSFHRLPKEGTGKDEWRQKLIHKINRVDSSFNPKNAVICSRHFLPTCFQTGPSGKKRLLPGSLPTEFMPTKTVETAKPPERKQPTPREPPTHVQRVCYYNLDDVKKDAAKLQPPWLILENTSDYLTVGTTGNGMVTKEVTVQSDLSTSVKVCGMTASHLNNNIESVSLKKYVSQLDLLHACPGIADPQLQQFASIPTSTQKSAEAYFLHATYSFSLDHPSCATCVRSEQCHVLSEAALCTKCVETQRLLVQKQTRAQKSDMQPLKPNDPLHSVSINKLKKALKCVRQSEKKHRQELEKFKKQLSHDSIALNMDQQEDMHAIIDNNLPSLKPLAQLFWKEQCKAFKVKGDSGMKWHPMMIRLALLIHSKSSAAYNLLRDTNILKLPGETTLRDYTNYIHPHTGFVPEILEEIQTASKKLSENQRYVVLLHDEMSIKEDLVFDSRSQELMGFVNMKNWDEDGNCQTLASHVLVFYVVGINSSLKASMGFFATRTATADELYPLFWEAVGYLERTCKLKVIASTSDKASPNQRLYQMHGQPQEICYKTKNFYSLDRYIYFFSDAPHLIKTVRNNLFRSGYGKTNLLWNNDKELIWKHIADLYTEDRTRPLWRLPKLTNDHIYVTSHGMMNVRYAAQVLSKTVGCVLQEHGGDAASETANFILMMNRFFDCLNTRSLSEGFEKKNQDLLAYTDRNDPRYDFLDEFLHYLEQWKMSVQTRQGNFSAADRAKMFLTRQTYRGLVMTIKSFKEASRYLLDHGVSFVLSNRFCQDPLEQHFGRHRSLNSRSDNPNLYRFGYQENKIRQSRTLAMAVQPKGNVEKRKRGDVEVTITNSPLKKARKGHQ